LPVKINPPGHLILGGQLWPVRGPDDGVLVTGMAARGRTASAAWNCWGTWRWALFGGAACR
jgi:hypothetical protein